MLRLLSLFATNRISFREALISFAADRHRINGDRTLLYHIGDSGGMREPMRAQGLADTEHRHSVSTLRCNPGETLGAPRGEPKSPVSELPQTSSGSHCSIAVLSSPATEPGAVESSGIPERAPCCCCCRTSSSSSSSSSSPWTSSSRGPWAARWARCSSRETSSSLAQRCDAMAWRRSRMPPKWIPPSGSWRCFASICGVEKGLLGRR